MHQRTWSLASLTWITTALLPVARASTTTATSNTFSHKLRLRRSCRCRAPNISCWAWVMWGRFTSAADPCCHSTTTSWSLGSGCLAAAAAAVRATTVLRRCSALPISTARLSSSSARRTSPAAKTHIARQDRWRLLLPHQPWPQSLCLWLHRWTTCASLAYCATACKRDGAEHRRQTLNDTCRV